MATFASLAGVKLPENDREGKPIIFDSYDMSPILFGTGKSERKAWFYFTENELTPGAVRVGHFKAVFNLRGDDGQQTGGLAVDSNLGWKGAEKYVATVPQIFDLWQDPQERYDIFMNNYTEHTWTLVTINADVKKLMQTLHQIPAAQAPERNLHRADHHLGYQRFQLMRDKMQQEVFDLPLPPATDSRGLQRPHHGFHEGRSLRAALFFSDGRSEVQCREPRDECRSLRVHAPSRHPKGYSVDRPSAHGQYPLVRLPSMGDLTARNAATCDIDVVNLLCNKPNCRVYT